ncbi:MAG TPA: alpha/beta hydrolase [Pyrinomonadaceae bacterium]|jgi:alpha-beta hydrolase superfamily lysophospholipase|nr:alpha/beta hydrolase [Pyrinomonadaceae bacterium]
MKESSFEGVGGLKIATRSWQPEGTPRGIMILVHGFNAHSGYMVWPGEQFAKNGLASYALDLRGRGKSEGERFYVENLSDYLGDVDKLVNIARSENPGLPVYVLGHSAGGVISSSYVFEHQDEIAGLICESFAYDVGLPHLVQLALEGVGKIAPHVHVFSLNNADFSRDPVAVERMNNDPLIHKESQPAETARVLLLAADALTGHFPQFKVPVLIIHGTDDKATRPAGSQKFYDTAGSADKTLKLYEGHYHDLLNDLDKEIVMADIQSWIDERIPAETSATAA